MPKVTGMDKAIKQLEQLAKNFEEFDGEHHVPVSEMMPPSFIQRCTNGNFASVEKLFDASGFKIESLEDLNADDEMDTFIRNNTNYASWEEMKKEAGVQFMKNLLTKGLE